MCAPSVVCSVDVVWYLRDPPWQGQSDRRIVLNFADGVVHLDRIYEVTDVNILVVFLRR
jgi:hypothetical protein